MPLTAEVAAAQVQVILSYSTFDMSETDLMRNNCCLQERLKAIQVLIHDIDNERRRNETNLNNLYRLQEKYGSDEKSNSAQHKLRSQYKICMNDAVQEENVLRQALGKILEIRNIRNERRIQVVLKVLPIAIT